MDGCVNVFVGDYFSPYDDIPFDKQLEIFFGIINYKKEHPETVLLRGNHDLGGYVSRPYNRDDVNSRFVNKIIKDHENELQTALSIDNKVLVTHAGVSFVWYDIYKNKQFAKRVIDCSYDQPDEIESPITHKMCKTYNPVKFSECKTPEEAYKKFYDHYYQWYAEENKKPADKQFLKWNNKLWQFCEEDEKFNEFRVTPDELAEYINGLWSDGKYSAFSFDANAGPLDYYGTSEGHGPLWIRPDTLKDVNAFEFSDYWQIVGHTQTPHPFVNNDEHIAYVDCLQYNTESLIYDSETNKFTINKPE